MSDRDTTRQNREQAVQRITEQNHLQKLIGKARKDLAEIQEELIQALERENDREAERLRPIMQEQRQVLEAFEQQVSEKSVEIEGIKAVMREEEEKVRQKFAEALRQNAERRHSQWPGDFPGAEYRIEPGAIAMCVAACLLLSVAVIALVSWLR